MFGNVWYPVKDCHPPREQKEKGVHGSERCGWAGGARRKGYYRDVLSRKWKWPPGSDLLQENQWPSSRKTNQPNKNPFWSAAFIDSWGVNTFTVDDVKPPKWGQLVCIIPGILTTGSSISLGLRDHWKDPNLDSVRGEVIR